MQSAQVLLKQKANFESSDLPAELLAKVIAETEASLRRLKEQPAAVAVKTLRECFNEAQSAVDVIETRKAAVTAMSRKVADQLESIKQDYVAAANAVVRVNEALAKASAQRDAALSALMIPAAPSAAAAPTVPAASVQELASSAVRELNDKLLGMIKETT